MDNENMNREVGEHNGGTMVLGQSGEGEGRGCFLGAGRWGFLKGRMQEKMNVRIVCKG